MWSHRGVSGATGRSACRVRPRRLAAPRCWTERSPNPRCSPWQGAQPLTGWFSRQIRDATPVSSPAAAPRHCRHAWQSTLCRDGCCRRAATGSSPGACRHEALAGAPRSQQTEEEGPRPHPQGHHHLWRVRKPAWGGQRRQEEIQGGRDMGNLPGCPSAPGASSAGNEDSHCHLHHLQKESPNCASCPVLPSPVFWL